jgi:hypothetical protein
LQEGHRYRGVPFAVFPQRIIPFLQRRQRFFCVIMEHHSLIVPKKQKTARIFLAVFDIGTNTKGVLTHFSIIR